MDYDTGLLREFWEAYWYVYTNIAILDYSSEHELFMFIRDSYSTCVHGGGVTIYDVGYKLVGNS